ncbi:hypothetical protein [Massilia sp. CT11-137]|uniref:hypothetical protein n=1 Tax=Massilia sp. CT11-137 TaxID=3393901 RepID=UPI0039A5D6D7
MKTISSTITPISDRPAAGTASTAKPETSRAPKRTFGFSLPVLGRRPKTQPSAANVQAPLQRLEQFSARHAQTQAPAPERVTLADMLHADKSPTLAELMRADDDAASTPAAPAARPKTFGKLASGPKIDCMADTLTSIDRLDEQQVSQITEALGMGPAAAPGRERDAQLKAAGRLLRAPLDLHPPAPDSATIGRTQFGRGMPPDVLASLSRAARAANCFVTERQAPVPTGRR